MLRIYILVMVFCFCAAVFPGDYYVNNLTGNDNNGGTHPVTDAWETIVHALAAGSPLTAGDTLYIMPGTYYPTKQILCEVEGAVGNPITVKAYDNGEVIIDGTNVPFPEGYRAIIKTDVDEYGIGSNFIFENLTIRNAYKIDTGNIFGFLAVLAQNITIRNCVFHNIQNAAIRISHLSQNILIEGCTFHTIEGSAIALAGSDPGPSGVEIRDNEMYDCWTNTTPGNMGGVIFTRKTSSFSIINNIIRDVGPGNPWWGGEGIYVFEGSTNGIIKGNAIYNLSSSTNGNIGVNLRATAALPIENVTISENIIGEYNGRRSWSGIRFSTDSDPASQVNNVEITNNVVWGYRFGIELYESHGAAYSNITMLNNTSVDNDYGIILGEDPSGVTIVNNLCSWNDDGQIVFRSTASGTGYILGNNIHDGRLDSLRELTHATDILMNDPASLFVDLVGRDYRLVETSAARNAGDNAYAPPIDIEGVSRPIESICDIGAYELEIIIDAGAEQVVFLPVDTAVMAGSVYPADAAVSWTYTAEGAGSAAFTDDTDPLTTVTFSVEDTYTLTLTSDTDPGISSSVIITVLPAGAVFIDAGETQDVIGPDATLEAVIDPTWAAVTWTQTAGPVGGSVVFADPADPVSGVDFNMEGTYTLQLTSDVDGSYFDTVDINVVFVNVEAGDPYTITSRDGYGVLLGSITPAGLTGVWTQTAGPAPAMIEDSTSLTTQVTFLENGIYEFTLTSVDDSSASDTVIVTVDKKRAKLKGGCNIDIASENPIQFINMIIIGILIFAVIRWRIR